MNNLFSKIKVKSIFGKLRPAISAKKALVEVGGLLRFYHTIFFGEAEMASAVMCAPKIWAKWRAKY